MLQLVVMIAGLALLGQLLVGAFNWGRRNENLVYRLFQVIASPFVKLIRLVTPRFVLDQHIPIATFLLLFFLYFWLGFEHRDVCRKQLNQPGCERWAAQVNEAPR
jgi:uncharacterized protein YggT (Ycf19 family)